MGAQNSFTLNMIQWSMIILGEVFLTLSECLDYVFHMFIWNFSYIDIWIKRFKSCDMKKLTTLILISYGWLGFLYIWRLCVQVGLEVSQNDKNIWNLKCLLLKIIGKIILWSLFLIIIDKFISNYKNFLKNVHLVFCMTLWILELLTLPHC